jgi:ABC-type branched-subunit amino acid transport system substrate-binding protein/predicted negative regulator of RcsB-dependent stress response
MAACPDAMYRSARMWRSALSCAALVALASCAPKQVESPLEKAPPAEIAQARELAADGDVRGAQNAYESFIIAHPGTVEADLARLELGVLNADLNRCPSATQHFEQAQDSRDEAIALRATLHLGACQLRLGDPERALATIEPLSGERFTPEEQTLLWDIAIIASEQTTDGALALQVLDGLDEHGGDPPSSERVWDTAVLLASKVTIEEAQTLVTSLRPGGVPHTAVSMRALEDALTAQDVEAARESADALRGGQYATVPSVAMLVARADELLHGNPYAVGALLPLSGRGREVGRQLLQGMQLAQLQEGGPELIIEDTASDPSNVGAAVDRLVGDQGVVAVLGPVGSRATEAAAESTRRAGAPMISFSASETVTAAGDEVFRALYSPRDEVAALVRNARERGLSRFVILYPDHGYGRTLERLFDQEVAVAGGVACEGVAYPPGTKSLVEYVRTVLATTCDAVLLADVAEQVSLIAPTFAAEGAWSVGGGTLPEHAEREVHFLLPSPSWSSQLLRRSHRYLQGALIALPFYEAAETAINEQFRIAYTTRYGSPPQTFAAYGYDAYRLISGTLRQGHQSRQALADALRAGASIVSVTSVSALSGDRAPASPPQVYRVSDAVLMPAD